MPFSRSPIAAITGLIFVLQAWGFAALTAVLAPAIHRWDWLEVSDVLLGCGILDVAGMLLGLAALRHPAGKAATGLGILLLVVLLVV